MGQYLSSQQGSPANEHDVEAQPVHSRTADAETAHSPFQLFEGFGTSHDGPPHATLSNMPCSTAPSSTVATAEAPRPDWTTHTAEGWTVNWTSDNEETEVAAGWSTTPLVANETASRQQRSGMAPRHSGEPRAAKHAASSAKSRHGAPTAKRSHRDGVSKSVAPRTQQQGNSKEKERIAGTDRQAHARSEDTKSRASAKSDSSAHQAPQTKVHGSHHHSTTSAPVPRSAKPHAGVVAAGTATSSTSPSQHDISKRQQAKNEDTKSRTSAKSDSSPHQVAQTKVRGSHHHSATPASVPRSTAPHSGVVAAGTTSSSTSPPQENISERQQAKNEDTKSRASAKSDSSAHQAAQTKVHGSRHSATSASVSRSTAPHTGVVAARTASSSTSPSQQEISERQARRAQRRAARLRAALRRTWCWSCSVFCVMLALAASIASVAFKSAEQTQHLLQALDLPHIHVNASGPPLNSLENETIIDQTFDGFKRIGRLRRHRSG